MRQPLPHHPRGRLNPAAEHGVVLHLAPNRDRHPILEQRNLVLQKRGGQRGLALIRRHLEVRRTGEAFVNETVASAGDEILPRAKA